MLSKVSLYLKVKNTAILLSSVITFLLSCDNIYYDLAIFVGTGDSTESKTRHKSHSHSSQTLIK